MEHSPIASVFYPQFQFSSYTTVANIIHERSWSIPDNIPADVRSFLQRTCTNIHLPANLTVDHLCWTGNSSGILSLTEAWNQVRSRAVACPWASLAWGKLIHPRFSCFIWRLLHKKTPTQAWTRSIGFILASQCYLCKADEEPDYHLFFSCPFAVEIWTWVTLCIPPFYTSSGSSVFWYLVSYIYKI